MSFFNVLMGIIYSTLNLAIYILIIAIPVLIIGYLGQRKGNRKALRVLRKEINQTQNTNPYMYFREIPDDYGIGVYAFLLDYKISVRDLKSAIIDLSAKGYINIKTNNNTFEAEILEKDSSSLLHNERFILNWLCNNKNQSLKSFNISNWIVEIKRDIIELGLGQQREEVTLDSENKRTNFIRILTIVPTIIAFCSIYIFLFIKNTGIYHYEIFDSIFKNILNFIIWILFNSPLVIVITGILFLVFYLIASFIAIFHFTSRDNYYFKLSKNLKYTDKTKDTIQKIYSLGAFLKDFSIINKRDMEEIVIWERYLSYAYLLGLNDKFNMQNVKIYKNNNFWIDSNIDIVDTIMLNN